MEFIKPGVNIDFVGRRKLFFTITGVILLICLGSLAIRGLNFGIDFTGGSDIQVSFNQAIPAGDLRAAVENMGLADVEIQAFGESGAKAEYLIRIREQVTLINADQAAKLKEAIEGASDALGAGLTNFDYTAETGDRVYMIFDDSINTEELTKVFTAVGLAETTVVSEGRAEDFRYTANLQEIQGKIASTLATTFGDSFLQIERAEIVGPKAGSQLRNDGVLAMVVAIFAILLYIAIRFEFKYSPGAVLALVHDVLIMLGIWSLFGLQFSLTTVAALLTIIGYSINDTIVIYDRIRENVSYSKDKPLGEIMNQSINMTLSRTILTSFTTLLVVIALLILGSGVIREFALALAIGIVAGTYSSIALASPITLWFDKVLPEFYDKALGKKQGVKGARAKSAKAR